MGPLKVYFLLLVLCKNLRSEQNVTKGNFKQSTSGSNSEFSFSLTGCLTKVKEPSLLYYLPITRREEVD